MQLCRVKLPSVCGGSQIRHWPYIWFEYCIVNGPNFSLSRVIWCEQIKSWAVGSQFADKYRKLNVRKLQLWKKTLDWLALRSCRGPLLLISGSSALFVLVRIVVLYKQSCCCCCQQKHNQLMVRNWLILAINATKAPIICKINSLPWLLDK